MSEEHKKQLEQKLWDIANTLRGKKWMRMNLETIS
jgi:hypothetical protein